MLSPFTSLCRIALAASCGFAAGLLQAQDTTPPGETLIEIKAIAGLRFDVARFRVAPEAKVRVVLENADDMAHNLLFLAPDARVEIVTAAMTMPITPTQDFVPKSEKVLWTIPVLTPGKKGEVSFTAPKKEGVYPYVCSYPGHGFIMFGAMYVSKKAAMPPLEKDPNIPDTAKEQSGKALHAFTPKPPYLYRIFMRDSGPASFAVALPGEQNYCWDAGACRLRYAWRGPFLDPSAHWSGNGDAFGEVKGHIYWRGGVEFPIRIASKDTRPTVKFRGYRLVNRYPEFRYEVDGVEVRELIKAPHHGTGLESTFMLDQVQLPVFYVADPNAVAAFGSSVGKFEDGVLSLTPEQARNFTVTMGEIPNLEPLAYLSMNDVLADKKPLPVPGVKGRALVFDGKKSQFSTGVTTDVLAKGATLALWARAKNPKAENQVLLGARAGNEEFSLGWNFNGNQGIGFYTNDGKIDGTISVGKEVDTDWHFLALTYDGKFASLFVDGEMPAGAGGVIFPPKAPLFLGSVGGAKFAAATLDEVRIYGRALTPDEVRALYERDRKGAASSPSK